MDSSVGPTSKELVSQFSDIPRAKFARLCERDGFCTVIGFQDLPSRICGYVDE